MFVSYHSDFDKQIYGGFAFRQIDGFRKELPEFGQKPQFITMQKNSNNSTHQLPTVLFRECSPKPPLTPVSDKSKSR